MVWHSKLFISDKMSFIVLLIYLAETAFPKKVPFDTYLSVSLGIADEREPDEAHEVEGAPTQVF